MTNSTSTVSSNSLEEELMDDLEVNSDSDGVTKKHPGAFRTISEVAEEINIPQHVLRFWETRFKQVQPMKHSGGRRYYRAEDVSLLQYISELLYTQGYTIKGVQRLLDEDFSRFSTKNTNTEQQPCVDDVPPPVDSQETQEADHQLSQESVAYALELARLQEENKLLIRSLQSVLVELQELRKIIISEC